MFLHTSDTSDTVVGPSDTVVGPSDTVVARPWFIPPSNTPDTPVGGTLNTMTTAGRLQLPNLFGLHGYVCLVTNGESDTGLMAAQALAANGATVYIAGPVYEPLFQAARLFSPEPGLSRVGQIHPIPLADGNSKKELINVIKELTEREGYLSLLITAPGVFKPEPPPEVESGVESQESLWASEDIWDWSAVYNTNVSSVYFTTIACLQLLNAAPKNHAASVIVISNMSSLTRHTPSHCFNLNAAKAASAQLSKTMSRQFAGTRVRVNNIAPGRFDSPTAPTGVSLRRQRQPTDRPADRVRGCGPGVPTGRVGKTEEFGMAVIFLAKCDYVNGEVLTIDGGMMNEVGA